MKILKFVKVCFYAPLTLSLLILNLGPMAGYLNFCVQSGSMCPTIDVGSLAIVDTNCNYEELKEGDVIIFSVKDARVMHRVHRRVPEGIETKGDANSVADGVIVNAANYSGRVILAIPWLGIIISNPWYEFIALVICAIPYVIISFIEMVTKPSSNNKGD